MTFTDFIRIKNRLNFNPDESVVDSVLYSKLVKEINRTGIHYYGGVGFGGYSYEQTTYSNTETITHSLGDAFAGVERVRHRWYSIGRLGVRVRTLVYPRP